MPARIIQLLAAVGLCLLVNGLSGADSPSSPALAEIKKKDGSLLTGEIRGLIALRDLTPGEKGGWGLLYYLVPGSQIERIDEQGVHWRKGKDIDLLLYVLGQNPGDDLRGLSRDRVQQMKFLIAHQGSNSAASKVAPEINPIPVQVYGEVIYGQEPVRLLPEMEVRTGATVVKLSVSSLPAIKPMTKPVP